MTKTKFAGVYKNIGKKDISFYIRFKKNGKTETEKVGTKIGGMTETKAKRLLEEKKNLIIKGEDNNLNFPLLPSFSKIEKLSLNDLASLYFQKFDKLVKEEEHLEKSEKRYKDLEGVKREKSLYNNFWLNWEFSIIPFDKINTINFVEYIKELTKQTKVIRRKLENITVPKYSSKYILNALTLIKSIIKHTKCAYNPLDLSNNKTEEGERLEELYKFLKDKATPREAYLEPLEIKLLLDTLKSKQEHYQGYLIALIMATTGMRPNSVLNLKIKDLMFKDKIIKTYDFKRKMIYYCNLTPLLELDIQDLIRNRAKDEYVFYSITTKGYKKLERTPDYIATVISDLFNKNRFGKDRIVLYNLRHSFATNLIKGKKNELGEFEILPVQIFTIQKLLNHSKVETTIKHYAKFSPDFVFDVIKKYEESFF